MMSISADSNSEILNIKRIPSKDFFLKYQCLNPAHRDFVLIHLACGLGFDIAQ